MNCTNSLLDEAYASYSGLDLTLKDQSVLESHVQASSTPRRVNYTLWKTTLYERNDDYCPDQFNTFEHNSITNCDQLKRIQNNNQLHEINKQIDLPSAYYDTSHCCNTKISPTSYYQSVESKNSEYTSEIENHNTQVPLDLRLKSLPNICDVNNINNKNNDCVSVKVSKEGVVTQRGIFIHPLSSDHQMIHRRNNLNTTSQPIESENSFNIQSLLRNNVEVIDDCTTNSNLYTANSNTARRNCSNIQAVCQTTDSNFSFPQILVNYLHMMNPLALDSHPLKSSESHVLNEFLLPRLEESTEHLLPPPSSSSSSSSSSSLLLAFSSSVARTLQPNNQTSKLKLTRPANETINNSTNLETSEYRSTNMDPTEHNSKGTESNHQPVMHHHNLDCSSISSEEVVKTRPEWDRSVDLGKTPIIFYYPEPSDSKKRIKVRNLLHANFFSLSSYVALFSGTKSCHI
ncbi:unnamed protein product [Heterobilharzia americana]|nr:unnamed protein product [Heterobilharzia americana]